MGTIVFVHLYFTAYWNHIWCSILSLNIVDIYFTAENKKQKIPETKCSHKIYLLSLFFSNNNDNNQLLFLALEAKSCLL